MHAMLACDAKRMYSLHSQQQVTQLHVSVGCRLTDTDHRLLQGQDLEVLLTYTDHRFLQGQDLEAFKPQTSWLSLVTTGRKYAVATKGWFCIEVSFPVRKFD